MSGSALTTGRPTAQERRRAVRAGLASGGLLRMPGAFSPLVAMAVEDAGFEGAYVSGAALSADLGLPDVGLTTLSEVAGRGAQIARATSLPTLIDADTGFGEAMNVARTIQALEDAGLSGCHVEDQVNPKRCGHLDNKTLVPEDEMVRRIAAAVRSRRDPDFVIGARTDARAPEGLEAAIRRAPALRGRGRGHDLPRGADEREFAAFRRAITVPLLANMTEFAKSRLLGAAALESLGVNVVIYPVTTLRLAMRAVEEGLRAIAGEGTQESLVPRMQTRARLRPAADPPHPSLGFSENFF